MLAFAGICESTLCVSRQLDPVIDISHFISQADANDESDRRITVNRLVSAARILI
jgi:hypothetical protein